MTSRLPSPQQALAFLAVLVLVGAMRAWWGVDAGIDPRSPALEAATGALHTDQGHKVPARGDRSEGGATTSSASVPGPVPSESAGPLTFDSYPPQLRAGVLDTDVAALAEYLAGPEDEETEVQLRKVDCDAPPCILVVDVRADRDAAAPERGPMMRRLYARFGGVTWRVVGIGDQGDTTILWPQPFSEDDGEAYRLAELAGTRRAGREMREEFKLRFIEQGASPVELDEHLDALGL